MTERSGIIDTMSARMRTWRDSESFRKESPLWFGGGEVLGALLSGALGGWLGLTQLPDEPTRIQEFWHPAAGGVVGGVLGLVTVFSIILLWNLLHAPYKQRDEANEHIKTLEAELERPKLFDVVCPTTSLALPINRLDDGNYRASAASIGIQSILVAHRAGLTNVTRLIVMPEVRFSSADNWSVNRSVVVSPAQVRLPQSASAELSWDVTNVDQWVLDGLPLTMGKDELLTLPPMQISVADANEAGSSFDSFDKCLLTMRLVIRTDKGSPALPTQSIVLTRSDIRDSEIFKRIMGQQEAPPTQ